MRLHPLFFLFAVFVGVNTAQAAIKVGVFDNKPVVMNVDGVVTGFSIDVLEKVAQLEGWELEYVHDSFKNNFARLERNELDLIVGLAFTEARNKSFYYTEETLVNNWAMVLHRAAVKYDSMQTLKAKKIALIENNIHSKVFDSLMQRFGFEYETILVQSPSELFSIIENGQVDAGVINRLASLKMDEKYKLVPSPIIFNPVEVRYASSRQGQDTYLKTIDKHLNRWKENKQSFYYQAMDKWIDHREETNSLLLIALMFVLALLLVIVFYIYYVKNAAEKNVRKLADKDRERVLILENLVDGAVIIDQRGIVQSFNRAAEEMFRIKREQIVGKNIKMLMPESTASRHDSYLQAYNNDQDVAVVGTGREVTALRQDGEQFPMRLSIAELPGDENKSLQFLGVCVDLTMQKKQDRYIQHSQKMEAMGQLTGGIAHDYNNMLGVILGFTSLLKEKLDGDSRLAMYADQIERASDRGVSLTKKLLTFSRANKSEREDIDLNALLQDQAMMLEKTLTPRIKLELALAENLKHIYVDKSELIESIVNMAVNAMHAMPEGGRFIIRTELVDFDKTKRQYQLNSQGDCIHLMIKDTGIGMTEQQQSRIFEPFFSTKGDQGTGLGMSQVYGFVNEHEGSIDVDSKIGLGTCFDIFLPAYQSIEAVESEIKKPTFKEHAKGTLLVVDDEQSLLDLISEMLTDVGYKVLQASSGKQALELLINHDVDLLLTDIIMPDMDGYALVKNVMADFPDTKIQLMSGYSNIQGKNDMPNDLLNNMLKKPFSGSDLSERLQSHFL